MHYSRLLMLLVVVAGLLPGAVLAQDGGAACPVIVESAVAMAVRLCAETARDQACYGHATVEAPPQAGGPFQLAALGSMAPITHLQYVRTSPLEPAGGGWGIALLRPQANLPDAPPDQHVTLAVFGDATLEIVPDGAAGAQTISVRAGTMVVNEPSLAGMPFAGPLEDTTLSALGRLGDDLWVFVQMPDGQTGWVMTMMVTSDFGTLPTVNTTGQPVSSGPARVAAYTLTSGTGEALCGMVPGGLLVQTPTGGPDVSLTINGASLLLTPPTTLYLSAQPSSATTHGELTAVVLEGQLALAALGTT
ncbi:MAG: hypothetical protein JXN59_18095, partial [Anaerolineae bacterium]|nr:hypothetical protein [Anaerolineae bacterium]